MSTNPLVIDEHRNTLPADNDPMRLLTIAVERGSDVESLVKIMDLQERWTQEQARKAFVSARAKFQSICPAINKDKEVSYGNTKYSYATLSHIADTVRDAMHECGLTYRFEFNESEGVLSTTCIVSHVDGHSESNQMSALPDDSGAKNLIQQRGSTISYLQRYTLIGALGLTSAMTDDDGGSTGATNVERLIEHNNCVRELFDSVYAIKCALRDGEMDRALEARMELSDEEVTKLNLAPTKGGIFSTEERRQMKSNEWVAARNAWAKANLTEEKTDE